MAESPGTNRAFWTKGLAVSAWCLIWLLPLSAIAYRAAFRSSIPADSDFSASNSILGPPSWFDSGSSFARWPELILRSLRLSVLGAITATSAGVILALLLVRSRWSYAVMFRFFWSVALFLPLPVVATVWLGAFSNLGRSQAFGISSRPLISGWLAAWLVHSVAALPLVVTILGAAFERTDSDLEDLARISHSPFSAIARSSVRSVRPAIFASLLIVLIMTAGDMTVTDIVQERTFAEEAYLQAQMGDGLTAASRTALPIMAMVSGSILWWARFEMHRFGVVAGRGFRKTQPKPWFSGRTGTFAGFCVLIVTGVLGVLPLGSLVWRAGRSGGLASIDRQPSWSFAALFRNLADAIPDLAETIQWTIILAAMLALFGTVFAWWMVSAMCSSRFGRACLALGAVLGLSVPGPVAGLAVLWVWMPVPFLYDSLFVVLLAVLFRFMGVSVFLLWAASHSIPQETEELARLDGLGEFDRFRKVRWPYMAPGALVSAILLFAFAVGELPAANMTVPPGVELMSVRLWSLMHTGMESHLAAFVLLLVITFTIFFGFVTLSLMRVLRRTNSDSRMIE